MNHYTISPRLALSPRGQNHCEHSLRGTRHPWFRGRVASSIEHCTQTAQEHDAFFPPQEHHTIASEDAIPRLTISIRLEKSRRVLDAVPGVGATPRSEPSGSWDSWRRTRLLQSESVIAGRGSIPGRELPGCLGLVLLLDGQPILPAGILLPTGPPRAPLEAEAFTIAGVPPLGRGESSQQKGARTRK